MGGIHFHYQSKAEPHKGQSQLVDLQGCSAISTQGYRQTELGRY
jgi:hypothetical protein